MKKNVKNEKVLKAISLGIAAMMALTSMPLNAFAEDVQVTGDGNTTSIDQQSETKTATENAATESKKIADSYKETEESVDAVITQDDKETTDNEADSLTTQVGVVMDTVGGDAVNDNNNVTKSDKEKEAAVKIKGDLDTIDAATTNANKDIKAAEEDSKAVATAMELAATEEGKAGEALDSVETKVGNAETFADGMKSIAKNANDALDNADVLVASTTTVEDAQQTYDEAVKAAEDAQAEFEKKEKEYDNLKSEYETAKKAYEDAVAEYNKQLNLAQNGNKAAQDDLAAAKEDLEKAKEAEKDLLSQVTAAAQAAGEAGTAAVNAAQEEVELKAGLEKTAKEAYDSAAASKNKASDDASKKNSAYSTASEDYESANSAYHSLKAGTLLENLNRGSYPAIDELFAEVVEGYYVSNVLAPGATNVHLIPASELDDAKNYAYRGYFVHSTPDKGNYAKVSYDIINGNGELETKYAYLNYEREDNNNKRIVIYEKAASEENGNVVYKKANQLNEDNEDFQNWLSYSAQDEAEKAKKNLDNAVEEFETIESELNAIDGVDRIGTVADSIQDAIKFIEEANKDVSNAHCNDLRLQSRNIAEDMIRYYISANNDGIVEIDKFYTGQIEDGHNIASLSYYVEKDGKKIKKHESYYYYFDFYTVTDKVNDEGKVRDIDTSKIKIYSADGYGKDNSTQKDLILTYDQMVGVIDNYNSKISAIEEAARKAEEAYSANEKAQNACAVANIDVLKKANSSSWDEIDKRFKEIVEGYYVSNVLVPGATNVSVVLASEVDDPDSTDKGTYFVKFKGQSERNYAKVSYDVRKSDGTLETKYVYLNYEYNKSTKDVIIFEKTEEVQGGKTVYTNAKYDAFKTDSTNVDKILVEGNDTNYQKWLTDNRYNVTDSLNTLSNNLNTAFDALNTARTDKINADNILASAVSAYNTAVTNYTTAAQDTETAKQTKAAVQEAAKAEIATKKSQYNELKTKLKEANSRLEAAEEKVNNISSKIEELSGTITNLLSSEKNANFLAMNSELSSLEGKLANAETAKSAAKEELAKITDKITTLTTTLNAKKAEIAEIERRRREAENNAGEENEENAVIEIASETEDVVVAVPAVGRVAAAPIASGAQAVVPAANETQAAPVAAVAGARRNNKINNANVAADTVEDTKTTSGSVNSTQDEDIKEDSYEAKDAEVVNINESQVALAENPFEEESSSSSLAWLFALFAGVFSATSAVVYRNRKKKVAETDTKED